MFQQAPAIRTNRTKFWKKDSTRCGKSAHPEIVFRTYQTPHGRRSKFKILGFHPCCPDQTWNTWSVFQVFGATKLFPDPELRFLIRDMVLPKAEGGIRVWLLSFRSDLWSCTLKHLKMDRIAKGLCAWVYFWSGVFVAKGAPSGWSPR